MASYTEDERQTALDTAQAVGTAEAARQLDIPENTIRRWARDRPDAAQGETMSDTSDAAPASAGKGKSSKSNKPKGKAPSKTDLESLIALVGFQVWLLNAYDGERIMEGSDKLAGALHQLAKDNAAVRRALQVLLTTSSWGALASALAPIVVPIAENHGMLKAGAHSMVGAPTPPGVKAADGTVTPMFNSPDGPGPAGGNGPAGGSGPADGKPAGTPDDPADA